jgi:phosphatidylglycerol:prolipoprotein diacylglycerol transferase
MNHWVHNLDPILLHLGPNFGIRYYGLAYLLGFLVAFWMMRRMRQKGRFPLDADQQASALSACVLGVLVGGRLGYCFFYALPQTLSNPLFVFKIWEGGMASHGGFIGVFLAALWIVKKFRLQWRSFLDHLAPLVPPGLLLGRIANFINGELWGKVTTLPWGVIFPQSALPGTLLAEIPARHPSQLYEASLEGAVMLLFTQWRFWYTKATASPGRLAGEFLMGYSVMRFLGEQFREPDAGLLLGVSRGVFYSLFLFLTGAWLWASSAKKQTSQKPGLP